MAIRKKLRDNPAIAYSLLAVLVVSTLAILFVNTRPAPAPFGEPRWAFDLNTGKLFIAAADQVSPIETDSGLFDYSGLGEAGAGVDAYVYSCGDPKDVEVGMTLEDLDTIGARLTVVGRTAPNADELEGAGVNATLVSTIEGNNWVPAQSRQGVELQSLAIARCESGDRPWRCVPR